MINPNIVDRILQGWQPIPHKCEKCGAQLYIENRKYHKGKYYCSLAHMQKPRKSYNEWNRKKKTTN